MKTLKTIAIVGLGLMGASLAAACRRKFPRAKIIGITRSRRVLERARRRGWIHSGTTSPAEGARTADLVVLCTPVDAFPRILRELEAGARSGKLVTDIGSVKAPVVEWFEKRRWRHLEFVGAHPMTGSHRRGFDAADPGLYDHGWTFLVRGKKTRGESYTFVKKFWQRISPKVIEMGARKHDRIAAEISHLPHAAAVCLMLAPSNRSLCCAASGFLDGTRTAAGDASIWAPIFLSNRRFVRRSLRTFRKKIAAFEKALGRENPGALRRMLARVSRLRRRFPAGNLPLT